MTPQHMSLHSALNFSKYDLKANQRGTFSAEQRDLIELLGGIPTPPQKIRRPLLSARTTTASMPQIREITGHVQTVSHTRYVPGTTERAGYFTEAFYLFVRGADTEIELPIHHDAVSAFDPNRRYTVYFYVNRETPTLLSVEVAE